MTELYVAVKRRENGRAIVRFEVVMKMQFMNAEEISNEAQKATTALFPYSGLFG